MVLNVLHIFIFIIYVFLFILSSIPQLSAHLGMYPLFLDYLYIIYIIIHFFNQYRGFIIT